ncbi:MAG: hypothetical protein QNK32_09660 [Porticoccus sp.]|nr:hypothetical protein [Porticoccus sp.]
MSQADYSPWLEDTTKQYITDTIAPMPRIIVTAANKYGDYLLVGARHWDKIMDKQKNQMCPDIGSGKFEQGFIDQYGQFVGRKEAKIIALTNGQDLIGEDWGASLFSENLH